MYTIWAGSTRFYVAARQGRASVQETAHWYEATVVASGLSHGQAIGLLRELSDAAVIPGESRIVSAGYGPRNRREVAAEIALVLKDDVVVRSYWATLDGDGSEGELLMDTRDGYEPIPAGNVVPFHVIDSPSGTL